MVITEETSKFKLSMYVNFVQALNSDGTPITNAKNIGHGYGFYSSKGDATYLLCNDERDTHDGLNWLGDINEAPTTNKKISEDGKMGKEAYKDAYPLDRKSVV